MMRRLTNPQSMQRNALHCKTKGALVLELNIEKWREILGKCPWLNFLDEEGEM